MRLGAEQVDPSVAALVIRQCVFRLERVWVERRRGEGGEYVPHQISDFSIAACAADDSSAANYSSAANAAPGTAHRSAIAWRATRPSANAAAAKRMSERVWRSDVQRHLSGRWLAVAQ